MPERTHTHRVLLRIRQRKSNLGIVPRLVDRAKLVAQVSSGLVELDPLGARDAVDIALLEAKALLFQRLHLGRGKRGPRARIR